MAFKMRPAKPVRKALLGLLFGKTREGKSTCLGTIGKPTLWLHTLHEAHGFDTAIAMAKHKFGDKACIMPVNIEMCEDIDVEFGLFKESAKLKIGDDLDANQIREKYKFYLNPDNIPKEVKAVVLDSITDLCRTLKDTRQFEKLCTVTGKDGQKYSHYKEREAYETMLQQEIIKPLAILRDRGIDCFCTISAKPTYDAEGTLISLTPDLPMFGVVETVAKSFPDVFPVARMVVESAEHVVFNMQMTVGKDQQHSKESAETGIKNRVRTHGRINSWASDIPYGLDFTQVPADFSKLRDSIEILMEDQGLK